MRNILNIIRNDFRLLTSSVVAIIIMLGLCIVPCLYAWFNIFSNWDPYAPTATGRIAVAVANNDEGADMLGLNINVGEMLTSELEANDSIGWTFVSRKQALEGLNAGDYYAAVIVPRDFSSDVMSFTTGVPEHPHLDYYENVKKNAIAPKITDKAQQALQQEIDAAFIETVGKYLSEASEVANEAGVDPEEAFLDLSDRLSLLSERMDDLAALVSASQGLSDAADQLVQASDTLAGSTRVTLKSGKKVLSREKKILARSGKDVKALSESVQKEANAVADGLDPLYQALSDAGTDMERFNDYVVNDLEAHKKLVKDMADSAAGAADRLSRLHLSGMARRFRNLSEKLMGIYNRLDGLEQADETTWEQTRQVIDDLLLDISNVQERARSLAEDAGQVADRKVDQSIAKASKAIRKLRTTLEDSYGDLGVLEGTLTNARKALKKLDSGLDVSMGSLLGLKKGLGSLAELFENLADSDLTADVNYLISDGTDVIAEHLASPIQMDTQVLYPVRNNGSTMAPFYTVLAQWVGALFAAVLIRTRVRRKEAGEGADGREPRLIEQFIGRYRLFLMVGLAQALIVSLGDLLYVGIQCRHPVLFVIAACVNGIVFVTVNYAVVFALQKVGMALCVIILLMQVAGGGGTFPPEVLPGVFRFLYPYVPFHYAIDAMRECIMGMYGMKYLTCLCVLLLTGAIAVVLGLLLARPASLLTGLIDRSLEKCDVMND